MKKSSLEGHCLAQPCTFWSISKSVNCKANFFKGSLSAWDWREGVRTQRESLICLTATNLVEYILATRKNWEKKIKMKTDWSYRIEHWLYFHISTSIMCNFISETTFFLTKSLSYRTARQQKGYFSHGKSANWLVNTQVYFEFEQHGHCLHWTPVWIVVSDPSCEPMRTLL